MGFIIQGLVSDWELFGNRAALDAARRNVDYIIGNWAKMPDNWEMKFITDRETTLGFGYGVARLYANTKDERYRRFLCNERSLGDWNDPIVLGRDKMIYGQAYGYLGTCLEQLELYSWDPRPEHRGRVHWRRRAVRQIAVPQGAIWDFHWDSKRVFQ